MPFFLFQLLPFFFRSSSSSSSFSFSSFAFSNFDQYCILASFVSPSLVAAPSGELSAGAIGGAVIGRRHADDISTQNISIEDMFRYTNSNFFVKFENEILRKFIRINMFILFWQVICKLNCRFHSKMERQILFQNKKQILQEIQISNFIGKKILVENSKKLCEYFLP